MESHRAVNRHHPKGGEIDSTRRTARVAGLLYMLMTITGFFSLMYVPGKLIVRGNAGAAASNLLAHETLFRLGIVSNVVAATIFIFLALASIGYSRASTSNTHRSW